MKLELKTKIFQENSNNAKHGIRYDMDYLKIKEKEINKQTIKVSQSNLPQSYL